MKISMNTILNHYMGMEMTDSKRLNYIGLLRFHMTMCVDSNCFCKKNSIFDIYKNKMIELGKVVIGEPLYMRNIIHNTVKKYVESSNKTVEAMIYYAEYLLKECNNIFSAHYYIRQAELESNISLRLKYKLYVLRKIIKIQVNPSEIGNKK